MIINTKRFQLKSLTTKDCTEKYLSWFSGSKEVAEYIVYAKTNADINKLRQYVNSGKIDKKHYFLEFLLSTSEI